MNKRQIARNATLTGLLLALAGPLHAEPVVPPMGDTGYNREPAPYVEQAPPTASGTMPQANGQPNNAQPTYVWQNQQPSGPNAVPAQMQASAPTSDEGLPTPVQSGNVRYITGGIGDEERDILEAAKKDYDLHITNVNTSGEFMGDTQITIKKSGGEQILQANAGPMFYVELPAGSYTVDALSNGQTKSQKVTVRPHKASSLYLRW